VDTERYITTMAIKNRRCEEEILLTWGM